MPEEGQLLAGRREPFVLRARQAAPHILGVDLEARVGGVDGREEHGADLVARAGEEPRRSRALAHELPVHEEGSPHVVVLEDVEDADEAVGRADGVEDQRELAPPDARAVVEGGPAPRLVPVGERRVARRGRRERGAACRGP